MNQDPPASPDPHPHRGRPTDDGEASPGVFVVLLTYTAPLVQVDDLLDAHRTWLDQRYAEGRFLASGPQVPRSGGLILARARSREAMLDVVGTDPFFRAGVASYEIVQFVPTRGPLAAALVGGA
ncbi:YciI family protein [Nocardioides sp. MAHUQ-72]|uniref:YciI family protein n=1 Tax=unclassified Nocardioides TaxID=2615069 RepID=UPI00360948EA